MRRVVVALGVWALLGCATAPVEVSVERLEEDLRALEQELDRVRWNPDQGSLAEIHNGATGLLGGHLLTRDQRVRALFLLADTAALRSDSGRLEEAHRSLRAQGPQLPQTLITAAWLAPNRAIDILQGAPPPADSNPRLLWELGMALARAGRHAEAVTAFDRALMGLSPTWRQNGRAVRDRSWDLRHAALTTDSLQTLARLENPTQGQFLVAVREFTPNVSALEWEPSKPLTRIRLAEWALHYVAEKRQNPDLRTRQGRRLRSRPSPTSPIPDIPLESPFLDAALFAVERNILPLPDGRNFFPEREVRGSEAASVVSRVRQNFD